LDKKQTKVAGDGMTIDEKIYVLSELDLNKTIGKLQIVVLQNEEKMKQIKLEKDKEIEIKKEKERREILLKNKQSSESDSIHLEDIYLFNKNKSLNEEDEKLKSSNFYKNKKLSNEKNNSDIEYDVKTICKGCFNIFE